MEEPKEEVKDEFLCKICFQLLLQPATIACGHTFCRECLIMSLQIKPSCPVCRDPCMYSTSQIPLSTVIQSMISVTYPKTQREREQQMELEKDLKRERESSREIKGEGIGSYAPPRREDMLIYSIPCYIEEGCVVMANSHIHLKMKEKRYVEMVQQILQGDRRFALVSKHVDINPSYVPDATRTEIGSWGTLMQLVDYRRENVRNHVVIKLIAKAISRFAGSPLFIPSHRRINMVGQIEHHNPPLLFTSGTLLNDSIAYQSYEHNQNVIFGAQQLATLYTSVKRKLTNEDQRYMERIYGGIPIFPTNAAVEAKLLYASNLSLYVGNQINDSPKTRFDILFDIDIERRIEWGMNKLTEKKGPVKILCIRGVNTITKAGISSGLASFLVLLALIFALLIGIYVR